MSDNSELVNLGVETDDSSFAAWISQVKDVQDSLQSLDSVIDQVGANASLQQQIDDLKAMSAAVDVAFDPYLSLIEQIGDSWQTADELLQQYMADIAKVTSADLSGAGAFGGTGDEEEGGGSLFGVARGLRAGAGIGRIAGASGATTGALTGAADVLYLEQAFQKLSDVLPGVGEAVTLFGNQLIGAIPAFEGIGVAASGMIVILAPIVAVLAATAAGIAIFNEEIKASQKLLDEALTSVDTYFKAIQQGTTESLNKELANLTAKKNAEDETLAFLQADYDRQKKALEDSGNQLGEATLEHSALADKINKLKDTTTSTAGEIEGLTRALDSDQVKAADAKQAWLDLADAMGKEVDQQLKQRSEFNANDQLTMDAAQKKLTALEQDRVAQQDAIERLQKFAYESGLSGDALEKNRVQVAQHIAVMNDDSDQIDHINNVSLGLIQTRKDEAQAVKDADEATKDYEADLKKIIDAQTAYDKAIQTARDNLINAANISQFKERTAEYQYTPGSTQDTFARDTIALKEQRDVAKIEEDTGDKIADIRTKLGETESKIVTDYNRQIFDDQIKYQDDVAKLVTDEHRQEQVDAIDHASRLASIRQQATDSELDDVANRDFAKLARDQRSASEKIQQENTNYALTEEKQRIHLANAEADLVTHLVQEEAAQQRAEGRKLADAEVAADNQITQTKTTEQRKVEALQDAEQQQLADLERNNIEKITLLRQAWYNEYEMQVIQENQREQLAYQTEQAIVSQNEAIMAAGTNAFIDDLNRLNAMAAGTSGGVSIPASSTPAPAPNPMIFGGSSASPAPGSTGTLDYQSIINGIGSVIQGMLGS